MNCPECGAPDSACETRYHEFLTKEFTDAGFGAIHHLTVATYMLQHSSKLSKEGWLYERELLREFLMENKSPELIRKQRKDIVDSGKRTFKFKSKDGKPVINKSTWTRTILDVRTENAEVYCEDVKAWARSALEDAEAIAMHGDRSPAQRMEVLRTRAVSPKGLHELRRGIHSPAVLIALT